MEDKYYKKYLKYKHKYLQLKYGSGKIISGKIISGNIIIEEVKSIIIDKINTKLIDVFLSDLNTLDISKFENKNKIEKNITNLKDIYPIIIDLLSIIFNTEQIDKLIKNVLENVIQNNKIIINNENITKIKNILTDSNTGIKKLLNDLKPKNSTQIIGNIPGVIKKLKNDFKRLKESNLYKDFINIENYKEILTKIEKSESKKLLGVETNPKLIFAKEFRNFLTKLNKELNDIKSK